MSEDRKKVGKIVGVPTDDFLSIVKYIHKEGLEDELRSLLKNNGHEHIAIEESVFDLIKGSLTKIQCGCKCMACYAE